MVPVFLSNPFSALFLMSALRPLPQAFDDLGIKKLPTVKSLQAEYAQLLEGKKKDYAEYRRSREEMRELLAAKANVDRLMGYGEERQNDREKEQGQDR